MRTPQKCKICGIAGHNKSNKTFHPPAPQDPDGDSDSDPDSTYSGADEDSDQDLAKSLNRVAAEADNQHLSEARWLELKEERRILVSYMLHWDIELRQYNRACPLSHVV